MHASTWDIVQQLYRSEINVGLQADFDGGIAVWIGGPVCTPGNAILASRTFGPEEFEDVATWLDRGSPPTVSKLYLRAELRAELGRRIIDCSHRTLLES